MSYRFRAVAAGAAAAAAVLVLAPPAGGAPAQQCDRTVGNSVDSYLTRHPDVKRDLNKRAQAESPGSPNALLDYLNRHPDVRQALITLSQQCTS
ncbi:MAG: hypothetical protein ABI307_08370 [Mycobacterium sp.]